MANLTAEIPIPDPEYWCGLDLEKAELPLLLFFSLIFNLFSLIILWKIKKTCKGVDYMTVCTLAINDFVSTLLLTIMWIGGWISCGYFMTSSWCAVLGWLVTATVIWSAFIIIVMSGCRYLATVRPLYYRTEVSTYSVAVGLLITWIWTLAQLVFPFTGLVAPYEYYNENRICAYNFAPGIYSSAHRFILGTLSAEGLLATFVTLFFNFRIIYEVSYHMSGIINQTRIQIYRV